MLWFHKGNYLGLTGKIIQEERDDTLNRVRWKSILFKSNFCVVKNSNCNYFNIIFCIFRPALIIENHASKYRLAVQNCASTQSLAAVWRTSGQNFGNIPILLLIASTFKRIWARFLKLNLWRLRETKWTFHDCKCLLNRHVQQNYTRSLVRCFIWAWLPPTLA